MLKKYINVTTQKVPNCSFIRNVRSYIEWGSLVPCKRWTKNHRNCPGAMVLCTTTEPKATTESEPIHCEQRAFSGFLKSLILPGKNRTAFSTVIGISFPQVKHMHFARTASKCLFKHTLCQCIHLCFAQMALKKTN